jgi:signal transduction histidine kinase
LTCLNSIIFFLSALFPPSHRFFSPATCVFVARRKCYLTGRKYATPPLAADELQDNLTTANEEFRTSNQEF